MITMIVSATLAAASPVPMVASAAMMPDMAAGSAMTHTAMPHHAKMAHAKSGKMDCCKKGCCAHMGKHASHKK